MLRLNLSLTVVASLCWEQHGSPTVNAFTASPIYRWTALFAMYKVTRLTQSRTSSGFFYSCAVRLEAIYLESGDRVTLPYKITLSTVYLEKIP